MENDHNNERTYVTPRYTYKYVGNSAPGTGFSYQNLEATPKKRKNSAFIAIVAVIISITVLAIIVFGIIGVWQSRDNTDENPVSEYSESTPQGDTSENNAESEKPYSPTKEHGDALSIPEIVQKVSPSVVYILVDQSSLGTGIILDTDGYILTNAHVVSGGSDYSINLLDGTVKKGTLIGSDSTTDIALLKMEEGNYTPAVLGDSDAAVSGETVVAIGTPYSPQLSWTVTQGIVSAIRKSINMNGTVMDLIQTDASINPGNSGGPLINEYGQIIGVTSLKIMQSSSFSTAEGLGFAIPINTAIPLINDFKTHGYITGRPMLGITGQYISEQYSRIYNMPSGIIIATVTDGTDAKTKGLLQYDIITKIDKLTFSSMDEFKAIIADHKVGDTVTLTVYRDDKYYDIPVILVESRS